jgi:hypothetical protein
MPMAGPSPELPSERDGSMPIEGSLVDHLPKARVQTIRQAIHPSPPAE